MGRRVSTFERMVLALHESHPLAAKESVSLVDLHEQHYVDRLRCEIRELFSEQVSARNLNVRPVMRSEREDLVKVSVSEGIGVSIMPESAAINAGLQTRLLNDMRTVRKISIVTVKERQLEPMTGRLIDLVCDAYRKDVDDTLGNTKQ